MFTPDKDGTKERRWENLKNVGLTFNAKFITRGQTKNSSVSES